MRRLKQVGLFYRLHLENLLIGTDCVYVWLVFRDHRLLCLTKPGMVHFATVACNHER